MDFYDLAFIFRMEKLLAILDGHSGQGTAGGGFGCDNFLYLTGINFSENASCAFLRFEKLGTNCPLASPSSITSKAQGGHLNALYDYFYFVRTLVNWFG